MNQRFRSSRGARRQQTSEELRDTILGFIGRHFYQGDLVALAKDRIRLLNWVVLKPAAWLDERGVTISSDAYRDLFLDAQNGLLMIALRHGQIGAVKYRPAWLGQVVESRLRIQGDLLYEKAKAYEASLTRNVVDQVVALVGGRTADQRPDPVRQMADASRLLSARTRPAKARPVGAQLSLL